MTKQTFRIYAAGGGHYAFAGSIAEAAAQVRAVCLSGESAVVDAGVIHSPTLVVSLVDGEWETKSRGTTPWSEKLLQILRRHG